MQQQHCAAVQEAEQLRQQLAEAAEVQEAQAQQLRDLERNLADAGKAWTAADKSVADMRVQAAKDQEAMKQQVILIILQSILSLCKRIGSAE